MNPATFCLGAQGRYLCVQRIARASTITCQYTQRSGDDIATGIACVTDEASGRDQAHATRDRIQAAQCHVHFRLVADVTTSRHRPGTIDHRNRALACFHVDRARATRAQSRCRRLGQRTIGHHSDAAGDGEYTRIKGHILVIRANSFGFQQHIAAAIRTDAR